MIIRILLLILGTFPFGASEHQHHTPLHPLTTNETTFPTAHPSQSPKNPAQPHSTGKHENGHRPTHHPSNATTEPTGIPTGAPSHHHKNSPPTHRHSATPTAPEPAINATAIPEDPGHHDEESALVDDESLTVAKYPPPNRTTDAEESVYDMELRPCSMEGMALTGPHRDGRCGPPEESFEGGSQPICISMPTFPTFVKGMGVPVPGGDEPDPHRRRRTSVYSLFFGSSGEEDEESGPSIREDNFFTMTGEINWMKEDVPCSNNPQKFCPVQHWCVNERAFATFVDRVGGCHNIGAVICDATNRRVMEAYETALEDDSEGGEVIAAALACLKQRCWLP